MKLKLELKNKSIGKKAKKRVVILLVLLLILGVGIFFGGRAVYNRFHTGTVSTYSLDDVGMIGNDFDDWESGSEATISMSEMQTETLSDTEKVSRIYVKKGQKVKRGQKLFEYDTTLTKIDVQRKYIAIQKLELQLAQEKKQLGVMLTYRAGVPVKNEIEPTPRQKSDSSKEKDEDSDLALMGKKTDYQLKPLEGSGTKEDPFCYEWSADYQFTDSFIEAAAQGLTEAYVQFYLNGANVDWKDPYVSEDEEDIQIDDRGTVDPNADSGGVYSASWTMQFRKTGGKWRYALLRVHTGGLSREISGGLPTGGNPDPDPDPDPTPDPDPDPDDPDNPEDPGTVYTAAQIRKMIADQRETIASTELEIKAARLEYKKAQMEMDNSVVKALINGKVTVLRNPNKTKKGKVFLKLSGSGAKYQLTSTVSEWKLNSVELGQSVTVKNEYTDETYEGKISKISRYPSSTGNDYYGDDIGTDSSYYPITIALDGKVDLSDDAYYTVKLNQSAEDGSEPIYLQYAFIRSDSKGSYIYVADKDQKLEKRYVRTGKDLWGSYTEIKSGLSRDERVAFPYGKTVREGAQTQEGNINDLYGYY